MEIKNDELVPFKAVPPGLTLKSELEERNIKQKDFAKQIGMQPSHLSELIKGKRAINAEIADKLATALGIPARFWLNMQCGYEVDLINIAKRDEAEAEAGAALGAYDSEIDVLAVLRRLFQDGTLHFLYEKLDALRSVINGDSADVVAAYGCGRFRKSDKVGTDQRMIRTWFVIAKYRAEQMHIEKPFCADACGDLPRRLREAFNANKDTISEVASILADYGIKFGVEPKLDKASIDGCSFETSDGHPCIMVTDRYDRIDWLAFTVLHELGHILSGRDLRCGGGLLCGKTEKDEQEADRFATSTLIPDDVWKTAPAFKPNLKSLERLYTSWAKEVGVNKWIALGRVSYELGIYAIRSDASRRIA